MLLLRVGDVSAMKLPASMEMLDLSHTQVIGEYEEDPHPRVPVTRKKGRPRRTGHVYFCNV